MNERRDGEKKEKKEKNNLTVKGCSYGFLSVIFFFLLFRLIFHYFMCRLGNGRAIKAEMCDVLVHVLRIDGFQPITENV